MNFDRYKPKNAIDLRGTRTKAMKRVDEFMRDHTVNLRASSMSARTESPLPTPPKKKPSPFLKEEDKVWNDAVSGIFRVASIVLVVAGSWVYLPGIAMSLSYFTDTEAAPANVMGSALLNIEAIGGGVEDLSCGEYAHFFVDAALDASRASVYTLQSEFKEGDPALCALLDVDVKLDGERHFVGMLTELVVPEATSSGEWQFDVGLPDSDEAHAISDGAYCTMDLVFEAFCPALGYDNGGFTDEDRVTITITKEGCEGDDCSQCCGNLYVDIVNENDGTIVNDFDVSTGTGGNEASGGGDIDTGDASTEVIIENELNENEVTISSCCEEDDCDEDDCDEECDTLNGCDEAAATAEGEELIEEDMANETEDTNIAGELAEEPAEEDTQEAEAEEITSPDLEQGEEVPEEPNEQEEGPDTPTAEDLMEDIQSQLDDRLSGMLGG